MFERLIANVARRVELNAGEQEYFTSLLQVKTVRRRQFLLQEGEVCRNEYFVNKGCLRAYVTDARGTEHVLQFAIEDWWIGDMHSFITQTPARITIDALEDSEVFSISRSGWDELMERVPKFERFFRMLLQGAFITLQNRVTSALSATAEQRYAEFQERYPQFEQRVPQHQVASYLGITPESLSRIRKQRAKSS
ncbi:Crp/Fnr family transcriptional regulator [Flaviaesturariibacter flavus]|uniref:Crp/Fnr family transcriptional regulator n=1 Tax=Flaviaesturariibacter flavus TaxID=2502780 RepID=A0A4V2NV90_9BACT|nr:Crp/Fnr family transcriptional regulator [Flaviaesturariibacter flavus]TCJ12506.1 Crp/Fnr family transcriptional regulator [Flaviaesturariibacter flavus]